ncbi:MAG: cytidylate kinase family protein, partial [Anaerolineae bacterium]|nr:cytidylate kinase family protein [Anaerolineae bacterium]
MPVITVSRLAGSGGAAIGQRIAETLGASYLDTQILHQVATRLGMSDAEAAQYDERAEAFIDRLARVMWLANPVVEPVTNTTPAL